MAKKKARSKAGTKSGRSRPVWVHCTYAELDEWRIERGLSKIALAKKLGVTNSTIHNWARGVAVPNITTQKKIRKIIDNSGSTALGDQVSTEGGQGETVQSLTRDIVKCYLETNQGKKMDIDELGRLIREVRNSLF